MRKFPLNSVPPKMLVNGKGYAFVQLPPGFRYVEDPYTEDLGFKLPLASESMSFGQYRNNLSFAGALVYLESVDRDKFTIRAVSLSPPDANESHIEFGKVGIVDAKRINNLDVWWTNDCRSLIARTLVASQQNTLRLLKFRVLPGHGAYFGTTCELSANPAYVYSVTLRCKPLDIRFTVYYKAQTRNLANLEAIHKFLIQSRPSQFNRAIDNDDNWEVSNQRVRYISLESSREINIFGNEWFDYETGDLWSTIDPKLMK